MATARLADASLPLVPSDEESMLRASVREIASAFGPDYYQQVTRAGDAPIELWQELGEKGFLGVHLPLDHGGGGLGLQALAIVCEETASVGCPLGLAGVSPGIVGTLLARHGSEEQQARWLPRVADASARICFAMTEPGAGSNSHRIATRVRRVDDGFRVTGQKHYISGADSCEMVLVVAAAHGPGDAPRGLSLVLVDLDAEGLERQIIPTALDEPEKQWTLFFDDVHADPDRLIGGWGAGLRVVFDGLNPERILFGAIACGLARYALEKACTYANERAVWGAPIGTHQAISHPLAEGRINLEQAALFVRLAAAAYDAGVDAGEMANIGKFAATETAVFCLDHAIQTHGGNGMALEYQLANYWFLARVLQIAPVSREMTLNYVAEHTLGLPRSY